MSTEIRIKKRFKAIQDKPVRMQLKHAIEQAFMNKECSNYSMYTHWKETIRSNWNKREDMSI
jgi:hypothetical protein|tara:strand:- start:247 stop:432 length:186 start_codon:yes stop_codon:yes gene_type:complete